ncbi:MAG: Trk system potassium transporter TrkA, partial [Clostridia bacterium]|nr:Trk system potassium transporter TrkA [Clostridia bacterium]
MNVIVAGSGKIGKSIVRSMLKENHNVTVIDVDRQVVSSMTDTFDVLGIVGNSTSYDVLNDAGVKSADLFIAVTSSDEVNMLSCYVAKKMGAKYTVARTRDFEYNRKSFDFVKDQLGLSMTINPELMTAQFIFNLLKLPSATNVEMFSRDSFEVLELNVNKNSPLVGVSLLELRKKILVDFIVFSVLRNGEVTVPNGSFVLNEGDKIGIISQITQSHKLLKLLGFEQKQVKDVVIIGASKIAYYLSSLLIKSKNPVKIIEKDRQKCEDISTRLQNVPAVICGDGTSHELLLENRVTDASALVALTNSDEANILMSYYANSKGVGKVVTKINNKELGSISNQLGVGSQISPKSIVANVLVRFARGLENVKGSKIETLYRLLDGKAETVEFLVLDEFKFKDIPLKNLKFKKNILIAGIIRDRSCIIPCGEDVIKA